MLEEGWQITGHFDGFCHVFLMSGQYFVTFKTMFRSQWLEADHCVNCIHLHVATTLEFCSYSYQMACIHTCIMWFRHYSHCWMSTWKQMFYDARNITIYIGKVIQVHELRFAKSLLKFITTNIIERRINYVWIPTEFFP